MDFVLAKQVRLFRPDFWFAIIGIVFLVIVFHYVGSIITNTNKYQDH